jgi:hypothetical protein
LLIVVVTAWHGVSIPTFRRVWHQLIERPDEPMRFRFILRRDGGDPAIRHGLKDARTGCPLFLTMLGNPRGAQRLE